MPELRNLLEIGFKFYMVLVVKQNTNFSNSFVKTYKNFTWKEIFHSAY